MWQKAAFPFPSPRSPPFPHHIHTTCRAKGAQLTACSVPLRENSTAPHH
jgi:hypothetical protein